MVSWLRHYCTAAEAPMGSVEAIKGNNDLFFFLVAVFLGFIKGVKGGIGQEKRFVCTRSIVIHLDVYSDDLLLNKKKKKRHFQPP
jgi:uncharacterized membrane protein YeiH